MTETTTTPMPPSTTTTTETTQAVRTMRKWVIIGLIALAVLILTPFVYTSVMLYKVHQENGLTQTMVRWFPFPAVIVNNQWVLYRDYQDDVNDAWAVIQRFSNDPSFQAQIGGTTPDHATVAQTELDRMVQVALLEQIAAKNNISITADDINKAYDDFVSAQGGDASQIESTLQSLYGWTVDQFKQKVVRELVLRQKVQEYLLANNHDEFTATQKTKITELHTQLQADPTQFAELAKTNSEDGSASQGGDLGWFGKGQMVQPFEDAAFALTDVNQVSDVVETQFGFHLIQLIEKKTDETKGEQVHARHILIQYSLDDYLTTQKDQATVWQWIEAGQLQ